MLPIIHYVIHYVIMVSIMCPSCYPLCHYVIIHYVAHYVALAERLLGFDGGYAGTTRYMNAETMCAVDLI